MKYLFSLFTLLITFSLTSHAQGPPNKTPEERAAETSKAMIAAIPDLTESQTAYLEELNLSYAEKQSAMFNEMRNGGDREAMRAKMTELRQEMDEDFKVFLTEGQYEKYLAFQKEQQELRRQGQGGRPNG